jgi:multisubunit Na+/H+ antiporter MnhB subunit
VFPLLWAFLSFIFGIIVLCIVLYIAKLGVDAVAEAGEMTFLTPKIRQLILAMIGLIGLVILLALLWNFFGEGLAWMFHGGHVP